MGDLDHDAPSLLRQPDNFLQQGLWIVIVLKDVQCQYKIGAAGEIIELRDAPILRAVQI
jgi:hypothetical protein